GLFTWGDTAYESYVNTLEVIEQCATFLERNYGKHRPVFGGARVSGPGQEQRRKQAAILAPVLRGLCSSQIRMVGHFTDDERVLTFINSQDLEKLAPMGTSSTDHFLRTKISPLVLDLQPDEPIDDIPALKTRLERAFTDYRTMYHEYYETCKHDNSPAIRDPNPVVILYPGIGMFTFAKDKQTARVAAEFYINAINVMKGAEAISAYTALPRQEAFNIEYWLLEEAKLQRMPKPKPLTGRIALITGSGGGIGKAIAKKFAEEGACVILSDNDAARLEDARRDFEQSFVRDVHRALQLDVSSAENIADAMEACALNYGGVDIIVNNAGLSISRALHEHTEREWNLLYDVLVKGQFLMTQAAAALMKNQGTGGDIVNIVSKNALVSGPNNAGY